MAAEEPGVEPQDREAIETYEASLAAFAEKLNLLHIAGGTPPTRPSPPPRCGRA